MKKLKNLLFDIIIGITFLYLINGFANAQVDWQTYGNTFTPLWHEQISTGTGRFDSGINNLSIANGYYSSLIGDASNLPLQPLIAHFSIDNPLYKEYLVFPNGNYLQIYDNSLNLRQEISTGTEAISQIDTLYWTNDTSSEDIAGLWQINSTAVSFRVYAYNSTSNNLIKIFEQNFSGVIASNRTSVRHSGKNAIFLLPISQVGTNYTSQFIKINSSGIVTQTNIYNRPCFYSEPLAFTDMNNDGFIEYLTYCVPNYYNSAGGNLMVFKDNGIIVYNYTSSGGGGGLRHLTDVKMFKPDFTSEWKLAILEGEAFGSYNANSWLTIRKLDGSIVWNQTYSGAGIGGEQGRLAIADDYNGDGINDIYMSIFASRFTTSFINYLDLKVISGNNGTTLASKLYGDIGDTNGNPVEETISLTLADLNNDGYNEFIFSQKDGYYIYDIKNDNLFVHRDSTSGATSYVFDSCIPADLNMDGFQEVICSGRGQTLEFYSGATNQNAVINFVTYSPSISIQKQNTVDAIINASDFEGNSPLYYISQCFDGGNWSVENNNNIQSCYYSVSGNYNMTVGVRDPYHVYYNYFSQNILVTETGTVCGNGICEIGETNQNCPNDCLSNDTTVIASDIGGVTLPTKIVDTANTEQGLLPEIYFGILAFLSGSLVPMMILVFLIFFVLIILAIGFIIKRVGQKVSELGR